MKLKLQIIANKWHRSTPGITNWSDRAHPACDPTHPRVGGLLADFWHCDSTKYVCCEASNALMNHFKHSELHNKLHQPTQCVCQQCSGPRAQGTEYGSLGKVVDDPCSTWTHTHARPRAHTQNYSQLKYCIQNSWNSSNVHHHNMITNEHRTWRHKY